MFLYKERPIIRIGVIPSDQILIDVFAKRQYGLRFHLPYAAQWSGIWDNNRAWALPTRLQEELKKG